MSKPNINENVLLAEQAYAAAMSSVTEDNSIVIQDAEGKDISKNMIEGYVGLTKDIQQTITLIQDIEMSSKEQLVGIEQINDAVNQLDRQTQQNAMVSSQTHDVAIVTDEIAKMVVSDANEKEFIGKDEVSARDMNKTLSQKKDNSVNIIESKKVSKKQKETVVTSDKTTNNDGEWESF